MSPAPVAGVLVDLDDTLFPQSAWLRGAWNAVAVAASPAVDARAFEAALVAVASEGSDRGRIIDRALATLDTTAAARVNVPALVAAFRAHRPERLECYPGARRALWALRAHVPVALVTDGDPQIQRGKLDALELAGAFDAIVCSDEWGRAQRKPSPVPFAAALERIGVRAEDAVMIGDRPDKDATGARAAGMRGTVRVRTGEYRAVPSADALAIVDDFAAAVAFLFPAVASERRGSAAPAADAEGHCEDRGGEQHVPRATATR